MKEKDYNYYFANYIRSINLFVIVNRGIIDSLDRSMEEAYDDSIQEMDGEFAPFYSSLNCLCIKWETNSNSSVDLKGSINILEEKDVLDWKSWDLCSPDFPQMENFTLLDYFYDEAAVGFYLGKPEKGLYYFEFDGDPQPINLSFEGYLEMVKFAKGAAYWQLSCIEPIDIASNPIIEKLNKIDSTITVEGFYNLYESLRIDK